MPEDQERRERIRACWLKLRSAHRVLMFSEEDKQAAQREFDVYFETLGYLPIEAIERAAAELQRTSKRMPTAQQWCVEADRVAARTAPDEVQMRAGRPAPPDHPVHAAKAKCIADLRALSERKRIPGIARFADQLERLPTRLPRRGRCGACNDTGLEELVCGRDGNFCGRELCADEQAGEHVYVRQCACRAA